jgi:Formin Homology 2 Domain
MCACTLVLQIAPKDDELKACQQYTGRLEDLSPPEQFLLTMSTVPRLHDKINALILMAQFQVCLGLGCLMINRDSSALQASALPHRSVARLAAV